MKSFIVAACVALLATCLLPASARADGVANPAFDSWAKFAVGSTSTYQQASEAAGHKVQVNVVKTLSEKADDHVTIESTSTMTVDGNTTPGQSHKETIPSTLAKLPDEKKLANEDVEVAGKKLNCTVNEMSMADHQGGQITVKIWTDADVPGSLVKMEAKSAGGTITMQLQSYDKK